MHNKLISIFIKKEFYLYFWILLFSVINVIYKVKCIQINYKSYFYFYYGICMALILFEIFSICLIHIRILFFMSLTSDHYAYYYWLGMMDLTKNDWAVNMSCVNYDRDKDWAWRKVTHTRVTKKIDMWEKLSKM